LRGIESSIGSQLHKSLLSDKLRKHAIFHLHREIRHITDLTFQTTKPSGVLTAFQDSRQAASATALPTFHTNQGGSYGIRKRQLPKSQADQL
jgi:hypothetical protein